MSETMEGVTLSDHEPEVLEPEIPAIIETYHRLKASNSSVFPSVNPWTAEDPNYISDFFWKLAV